MLEHFTIFISLNPKQAFFVIVDVGLSGVRYKEPLNVYVILFTTKDVYSAH